MSTIAEPLESEDLTAEANADPFEYQFVYRTIEPRFDRSFYVERYGGQISPEDDPVAHYIRAGWRQGFDPADYFCTAYYLRKYRDVVYAGLNPFFHFIVAGEAEGRSANANADTHAEAESAADLEFVIEIIGREFDVEFYRAQLPDSQADLSDLARHYAERGWREGLDPSPRFSTRFYLESNQDVRVDGVNPFFHFIGWGRSEGRKGVPDPALRTPPAQPSPSPAESMPDAPTPDPSDVDRALVSACNLERLDPAGQAKALETLRAAFDPDYYLEHSQDLRGASIDLFAHYMQYGWREHRNPSPRFSTEYYLRRYRDIASSGSNPFAHYVLHGRSEGRRGLSFEQSLRAKPFRPFVSVIIPNYNHARFLNQRIDSVLNQTYDNFELIILDDCSKDRSVEVIRGYAAQYPDRIRAIINEVNAGNVFAQWKRGLAAAKGELIWICESDDFCEPDFLEKCIQPFRDPSVTMAFGRIQFANKKGEPYEGLDQYREEAEKGIWSQPISRFAAEWFSGCFAAANIIPNVGGCVFRQQRISEAIWRETLTYKTSGDWFLYLMLARGGQLAYCPEAVAYFRQHGKNTSVTSFVRPYYYKEHERIIRSIRSQWNTPDDVCVRIYVNLYRHFKHLSAEKIIGPLSDHYSNDAVMNQKKATKHILMSFLGFHLGGGELFPIHLANALVELGYNVSALCLDTEKQERLVRDMLDPRVPIYDAEFVREYGIAAFVEKAGVDIIHTHNAGVEFMFFQTPGFQPRIPYVVTLHGSYEVTPIPDDMMYRLLKYVSHWIYLSPKNLRHLAGLPILRDHVTSLPNGMPIDDRPFEYGRSALGIGEDDLVFVLASRAIRDKGWEVAIKAMSLAQTKTSVTLHIVLCGSGPEFERLQPLYSDHPNVHLMGFQERITGAYRMGDVAILPSRFAGESYPLSLIQAMQAGRPIIATDIGEIRKMLNQGARCSGVTIPILEDDNEFIDEIAEAMLQMTDKAKWSAFAEDALAIGQDYAIENVAKLYSDLFHRVAERVSAGVAAVA